MSVPVLIKLTTTGPSITGPFSIYCLQGTTQLDPPLVTGVTKAQLIAGYYIVSPTGCGGLRVMSNGVDCTNYIDFVVFTPPTTTTTSTTSTTSTSTTTLPPCKCHEIEITGTVNVSWVDCENILQTFNYSNVTINVCARVGSITKTGTGTINIIQSNTTCVTQDDCWPALELDAVGIDKFMIRYLQIWGSPYTANQAIIPWMIDYGDGFTASFTGTQTFSNGGPADHTYSSSFTGTIKIKAPSLELIRTLIDKISGQSFTTGSVTLVGTELSKLTNLYFIQNLNWELNADVTEIPNSINNYYSLNGTTTGNISGLPSTLTAITLLGNETNTLSGNLSDFPTGLTILRIDGDNTITGGVNTLPASFDTQLTRFVLQGNNTISGNLGEFATYTALLEFDVTGFNTLVGSICNFNNIIQRIRILGYSSPSGNTSCLVTKTSLVTLQLENDEDDPMSPPGTTLTGDINNLPNSLVTVIVAGVNTLSGNISNMPTSISFWLLRGNNTVTGDISTIQAACDQFYHGGYHTLFGDIGTIPTGLTRFMVSYKAGGTADLSGIFGDISDIPTGIIQFDLYGNHTVNTYSTPRTWGPNMNYFQVRPTDRVTYAMPTAQLDQLIIDLASSTWVKTSSFNNYLYLVGTRSALSNAAYATLSAIPPPNNLTIDINP